MLARSLLALGSLVAALSFSTAHGESDAMRPLDGHYIAHDFHFQSGEVMPELRLHYTTFGKATKDSHGHVNNAVLIMHGTGGSAASLINDRFSGVLFQKGQLLDVNTHYIILPDAIGHGQSSKPSDGLRARFPQYDYHDMVTAQHELLTQGLKVDHLRLVMGTSMGCMHSFMWGEMYPEFMDALMPLACLPVQIVGRNRLWRNLIMEAIKNDPEYLKGEYVKEPIAAMRTAASLLAIATSAPIQMQLTLSTPDAADEFLRKYMQRELDDLDANDFLYQLNASRDYDPSASLEKITAPLVHINSGDDFVNPPELGIAEKQIKRIANGRFILIPASEQTHGHGTHTWAAVWQQYLAQLLQASKTPNN
jgi:homoserine O-acetyltransferase/O-succinyltransferase